VNERALRDPRLVASIEKYSGSTLLCVGDVMMDHYVYGTVARVSPEAPIPILSVDHSQSMPGGAGNVVRNLASLGAKTIFVTVTGDDEAAGTIEGLLAALPDCEHHLIRDRTRPTTVKTRYLAQGQQLLRVDGESAAPLADDVFEQVRERFEACLSKADVVILSDYAKGVLSGSRSQSLIAACLAAAKPVYVDPKGHDFRRYRDATLIKPNLRELAEATGMPVSDDAGVERAARHLLDQVKARIILVTRGAAGMMLVRQNEPAMSFQSRAREVFDVSGAGDTVAATLALGTAAGLGIEDAVEVACVAAGLVVGKAGTATLTQSELMRELENTGSLASDEKIMGVNEARRRIHLWRAMGLRVGFTSGYFGVVSAGDIAILRRARGNCNKLIVGLYQDSDAPIDQRAASDRSAVLAAMACVDLVVMCDDCDPADLIAELRPDVVLDGNGDGRGNGPA
jgi:D-beta-D-heptose 7-phosphate kinase/D-beta-D-heptose 1-phosphate adenosyltransferase